MITPARREHLYPVMLAKCQELGATPLALGGVADHVHLLVRLPPGIASATVVGAVKGASSHALNHQEPSGAFKWQGAYGAFSVSEQGVARVQSYIRDQETHHHALDSCAEWLVMQKDDIASDS